MLPHYVKDTGTSGNIDLPIMFVLISNFTQPLTAVERSKIQGGALYAPLVEIGNNWSAKIEDVFAEDPDNIAC